MAEKKEKNSIKKSASKKRLIKWAAVYQYILDYCNDTTIHGFKYMAATSRPWIERFFWMIIFTISTIGCALLISETFNKLQTNPITVSLAEQPTRIKEIPFPAVTVCAETQTIFQDSEFNFRDIVDEGDSFDFSSLNALDKTRLQAILLLCKPEYLNAVNFIGETTNLIAILRERAQLEWFKDQSGSWNEIYEAPFSLRLTPFGFCFTFNIMNASDVMNLKEVSPDFHYDRDIMMHSREINTNSDMPQERMNSTYDFPWISTHSAPDSGLTLTLNSAITSVDWWCSRFEGFNFYVHSPNELQSSTNNFQLQFGELTEVLIKPKLITTEEDLGSYNLERRNCYFEGEKALRFFKQYTKYNCEQECLSNYTRSQCGCVKYSVIRDATTKICDATELKCFEKAKFDLFNGDIYSKSLDRKEKYAALSSCQCLSECNALEYDVELVKTRKISLGKTNSTAIMKVFFKENQFVPLKRFQLYGTIDFLANCGGLLGLFVGVSVLSLIEILYYFILRLTCIWNNSREYKDEDVIKKNKKLSESSVKNLTVGNLYQHNWQRPMEKY